MKIHVNIRNHNATPKVT